MKKPLLLLFALSFVLHANSWAGNGIIRVKVYDDNTGEPLIGANVVIAGTTQGNVTDLDGSASIPNLSPGDYAIQVSYVSYQTKTIEDAHVGDGEVKVLDVRLSEESIGLDDVVVTAKALKDSENALLTLQKKSPKTFDAITSDQFSKNGDSDAASALSRVTGVTITSGKYVYVRGLGDRYSKSVLNGSEIPSLNPNRNSVQLDLFPSNLIDNIIVYKTFTPDLTGDFSGGLVDINTKDFPDRFNMQFSLSAGYNPQVNFNKDFLTSETSSTDFLGFDNGVWAIPSVVSQYTPDDFPQAYQEPKDALTTVSRAFDNSFVPSHGTQPINYGLNFSIGNQVQLFGKPLGFVLGLSYSRKYENYTNGTQNVFEGISKGQTNLDQDVLTTTKEHKSAMNVLLGGLLNTSYKINANNQIGLTFVANQSGTNDVRYQDGYRLDYSPDSSSHHLQNRAISWMQRSFENAQIKGEHQLKTLLNANLKWASALSLSDMQQPDVRLARNIYSINPNSEDTTYNFGNNDKPSRYYRKMNELTSSSKLDLTIPMTIISNEDAKLKFGGLFTYKNRSYHEDLYDYNIQDEGDFGSTGNISSFFEEDRLGYVDGTLKNYMQYYSYPDNNYDAYQRLFAGYGMIETPLVKNLRMTTGIRYEKTYMFLRSSADKTGTINTNDFLPALAFTYALSDNTNLRASATRTLARPSFREFAPLNTFDFLGGYIQNGNPDLKRTLIDNLDFRFEQYPSPGSYFAFSLFYKNFHDPIENTQLPGAGGSASQFEYRNVDQSQLYGAELELRKDLGSIWDKLRNFKISTNLTYVYSFVNVTDEEYLAISSWDSSPSKTRPMYNQAPFVINANLNYANQNNSWESTLGFNITGKRLVVYQVDLPSIYLQPMPELNFSVKRQLSTHFSLRFAAENLLDASHKEQIDLSDKVYYTTAYNEGRQFSVSLKYLFE